MKKIVLCLIVSLLFIPVVNAKNINEVELGSYITYKPIATSYMPDSTKTGFTECTWTYCISSTQEVLNPSELTSWRVLKINEDGTVDILSTYISSTGIGFGGKTGYINYVNELQKAAATYINPIYALSARSLGYDGQTLVITNTEALEDLSIPLKDGDKYPEMEKLGGGDKLYKTDEKQMQIAGIEPDVTTPSGVHTLGGVASMYWIASRLLADGDRGFGLRVASSTSDTFDYYFGIYYFESDGSFENHEYYLPIRPIVTLKSNLEVTGDGTEANPYVLSVKEETTTKATESTTKKSDADNNTMNDSTSTNKDEKVKNPKTGVVDLIGLFIICIGLIVVFIFNKKNITKFNKL